MASSKQMDRLNQIIKNAEKGLQGGIKSLQGSIKALTIGGGGIGPPKPKKELLKALRRLRKALNQAILALEKKLSGGGRTPARRKRKSAAA